MRIELLGGEFGIEDGVLLKWRVEFGSILESCVIFGVVLFVKVEKEKKIVKLEGVWFWFLNGREEGIF